MDSNNAQAQTAYAIGLVATSFALWHFDKPFTGLLAFGLGCFCLAAAGRLVLAAPALLATTAYGAWKLAGIVENPNLHSPQAAVLVVIVIGWCSVVIAALHFLSMRDDRWR